MLPVLLQLGPISIHTYGVLAAIGFFLGLSVVRGLAAGQGLDIRRVVDFAFYVLLVGFLGARLLFVATQWEYFYSQPWAVLRVWEGGLVFLGGVAAVVPFSIWYLRRYRFSYWKVGDVVMPGMVLAHAFGRLGCFASGCCYGRPTGTDFGVRLYSGLVEPASRGVLLHPTQLYESFALFLLFGGLWFLSRRKTFDGQVLLVYFLSYPWIRFAVEVFRGDELRGFVFGGRLSTSQFLSLVVFCLALGALAFRVRRVRRYAGSE